jgi:putative ABC transport system permease protein
MIKNYIRIAWRNVVRNKLFALVNTVGLGVGIGVSLLMLIHIQHELSFEKFFADHQLIQRVGSVRWAKTSPKLAGVLQKEIPGIGAIGRFYLDGSQAISFNERQIPTQYNYLVDSSIFSVFDFKFVYGDQATALSGHVSIVLTKSLALKLFGSIDPRGKTILINDKDPYQVTGVVEDLPSNSHLRIETLRSISGTEVDVHESFTWKAVDTYARFESAEALTSASSQLREFQYKYFEGKRTRQEVDAEGDYFQFHPIADIHLRSHREKEMGSNGDIKYVYVFGFLSVFIIAIAAINFINLFTAQSVRRMKEIGVKKIVGASRYQLVQQFLCETVLMTLAAALFAAALADAFLPFYNGMTGLSLTSAQLFSPGNLLILAAIVFVVALLSGVYPAIVITGKSITSSLRRSYADNGGGIPLRKVLVTFQFGVSVLVMFITIVVFQQMQYIHAKDLGFNKERVVTIRLYGKLSQNHPEVFRNELLKNKDVASVSLSAKTVGDRFGYDGFNLTGRTEEGINARFVRTDEGFIPTLGLQIVAGRNFLPGDTGVSYILNEKAAALLGGIEVVGRSFGYNSDEPLGPIVGIVHDYNFASLHSEIEPLVMEHATVGPSNLLVKISNTENLQETLQSIEKTITTFAPGVLVVFNFLDDRLNVLYENDNSMLKVFSVFAALAIAIAGLGLLALSAHSIETRVKEIGIRKVLGAATSNILLMFSTDYLKLVLIASVLVTPLAYYAANEWLASFAFRTGIAWWLFPAPAIMMMLLTMLIVIGQSLKAAMADPVKSLHYE